LVRTVRIWRAACHSETRGARSCQEAPGDAEARSEESGALPLAASVNESAPADRRLAPPAGRFGQQPPQCDGQPETAGGEDEERQPPGDRRQAAGHDEPEPGAGELPERDEPEDAGRFRGW